MLLIKLFLFCYFIFGFLFAIKHIFGLIDTIEDCLRKEAYYRSMVEIHGTSPTGAEYYVALQDLMIKNKEIFNEAELMKKNKILWNLQLCIPYILAWPYFLFIEDEIKSRD